ncbi:CfrBI family restriction endonuclease [Candidatus Parcubacteria bacterium]|nr:MAG: CfrBI family restriction endonuclease [Candidatus Parcubacteria bacterium]
MVSEPSFAFSNLLPQDAEELLSANGVALIQRIGLETARQVVLDVLCGRNLRDSTEMLTRKRLAWLNAALVDMLLRGAATEPDFIERLPQLAAQVLQRSRLSKTERWLAQWMLGLTDKASQNVLRDDAQLLTAYRERYEAVHEEVVRQVTQTLGHLDGELRLSTEASVVPLNWRFFLYFAAAIGAQTLTIRGSEKSVYGKLFERLVLGSLLHILGFTYRPRAEERRFHREFWLSSQQGERESDATALWEAGKGARFDIGFIGRGNPELSLDKVSRFARQIELGQTRWYMATIVIVDRIGRGSRLKAMASQVGGDVVQMSMSYWPQEVAQILHERLGLTHPLVEMPRQQIIPYLEEAIREVPLADFLPGASQQQSDKE